MVSLKEYSTLQIFFWEGGKGGGEKNLNRIEERP